MSRTGAGRNIGLKPLKGARGSAPCPSWSTAAHCAAVNFAPISMPRRSRCSLSHRYHQG
jgi:hypothetical protein